MRALNRFEKTKFITVVKPIKHIHTQEGSHEKRTIQAGRNV